MIILSVKHSGRKYLLDRNDDSIHTLDTDGSSANKRGEYMIVRLQVKRVRGECKKHSIIMCNL